MDDLRRCGTDQAGRRRETLRISGKEVRLTNLQKVFWPESGRTAWGRTLAGVYSVRSRAGAPVSTPLEWREVEEGVRPGDFTMDTVPERLAALGDLWLPLRRARGRFDLEQVAS